MIEKPKITRIAIAYNPIAGRGRGPELARLFSDSLSSNGYVVVCTGDKDLLDGAGVSVLRNCDLLVIAGGDGTLMRHLAALCDSQIPVFLIPTGNESLFAKEFGMDGTVEQLLRALRAPNIESHFVPLIGGRNFFSMVSIGLDSEVIESLSKSRTSTVNHFSYVLPTCRHILSHQTPIISLEIDGKAVLEKQSGFLIVGNNSQYALGLKWLPEATGKQNFLSARFFPYKSIWSYLIKVLCMLVKLNRAKRSSETFSGRNFTIRSYSPSGEIRGYPVQADGEFVGETPIGVSIGNQQVRILLPS